MDDDVIGSRSFGLGNIAAVPDYREEDQFTVLVADAHATKRYRQATQLHCVKASALSASELAARRVILKIHNKAADLAEVVIGLVENAKSNRPTYKRLDGAAVDQDDVEVLGAVIGSYSRE